MSPANNPSEFGSGEPDQLSVERSAFLLNPAAPPEQARGSVHWEEITCLGYNPALRRMEAIVHLKQNSGYGGDFCPAGTAEFVRFYVDFMDGQGFVDLGVASFTSADRFNPAPGVPPPLSYMVFLDLDDATGGRFIVRRTALAPTLRAILSWRTPAPPASPDFTPHFGNTRDAHIMLQARPAARTLEVFDLAGASRPPGATRSDEPPPAKESGPAPAPESTATQPFPDARPAFALAHLKKLPVLKIDPAPMLSPCTTGEKEADAGFEELVGLGLHPGSDTLGAVVHVKRLPGYHGELCHAGSTEHVAFWADWNNDGIFEHHLGTTSFEIPGPAGVPPDGLFYNVTLPIDVSWHLRGGDGPNLLRVRAVLSWEALPSATEIDRPNPWGNSLDALVALRPGAAAGLHARVSLVGNVDRQLVDPDLHLYNCTPGVPTAAHNRPWGGSISFHGAIDRNGYDGLIRYRFCYKPSDAPDREYQPVSMVESFRLCQPFANATPYNDIQSADSQGWYVYLPNPTFGTFGFGHNYLAHLQASVLPDGKYTVRFEFTDELGRPVLGDVFSIVICNQGMSTSPAFHRSIDYAKDLDLVIDGQDRPPTGANHSVVTGRLRAVHPYFGGWTLTVRSAAHPSEVSPQPACRQHSARADTGDTDVAWFLDSAPLAACGYTISLDAWSRVILNSNPGRFPHYGPKAVGYAKLPYAGPIPSDHG